MPPKIKPSADLFNAQSPGIRDDIIRMILQYLQDEGFQHSRLTLYDEANFKRHEYEDQLVDLKRMRKALLEGDWMEVDKLIASKPFRNQKSFLYAVYKQQYLEYIEHHELHKAFTFLSKRLKPLEHLQTTPNEFKDLCYLLTARSVQDANSFRSWEGIAAGREKLVEQFQNMFNFEQMSNEGSLYVEPHRLLKMLRQAVAHQIESNRYHPQISPRVTTLLQDYTSNIVPNRCHQIYFGHRVNVKCVHWVGEEGSMLASGSSDNTIRLWDPDFSSSDPQPNQGLIAILEGHSSKIWDLSSNQDGTILASAGGDSTAKIWDLAAAKKTCIETLTGHAGDIYSIEFHPDGAHVLTGGYDKVVRLYDIRKGSVLKTFSGHDLSVSKCVFNTYGNLIVSGSKDSSIKFWDINSGLCVKTISSHLGEVTSVEMSRNGSQLLSSSKDNSVRLWDIRMVRPIRRFKGHQNTSKNFIRAGFAGSSLIVSGSEDGMVYVWDADRGDLIERLQGHEGVVYGVATNSSKGKWATVSDDRTVRTWVFDENICLDAA